MAASGRKHSGSVIEGVHLWACAITETADSLEWYRFLNAPNPFELYFEMAEDKEKEKATAAGSEVSGSHN